MKKEGKKPVPLQRIVRLMEFMLEKQGENKNGVSIDEIYENVYSENEPGDGQRKAFERDRDIIKNYFKEKYIEDDERRTGSIERGNPHTPQYFFKTKKNGVTYWKYEGSWKFIDYSKDKRARVLLIGLELAKKYLYGEDKEIGDKLSEIIMAAVPDKVRKEVNGIISGMRFEKSILGLAEDVKTDLTNVASVERSKYFDMLLDAINDREKRFLWLIYSSPYSEHEEVLFVPGRVYFADHDWYCVGIMLNKNYAIDKNLSAFDLMDKAKVSKIRLSRIEKLSYCTRTLSDRAIELASDEGYFFKNLEKIMECMYRGEYSFSLMDVSKAGFGEKAEIELRFTGAAVDSIQRISLLYGDKKTLKDSGENSKTLEYTAKVCLLKKDGNPDLERDNNLKMAIFKMADSVTVIRPPKLQEEAIKIAEGFIKRTRDAMNK